MKYLLTALVTGLLSFSVYAGSNGSTEMGPFVDCQYPDGSRDYVPSMICKMNGGKRLY